MKQSQDFEAQQVAELCDTDDWGEIHDIISDNR
jgi:hypothetical protein